MLPPTTMEDAEIVSELGKNAISDLAYERGRDSAIRAACAYALRLIDHDDARAARRVYAEHENDWSVLDELAQTIPVAELAFIARGVTDGSARFRMPRVMHNRLVRQAAGLVPEAPRQAARALVRRLSDLLINAEDEAIGLFQKRSLEEGDFAAIHARLLGPSVTDAAVAALAAKESSLAALTTLHLDATKVSDKGVSALAAKDSGLGALTTLHLDATKVSDKGVSALAAKESGLRALTTLSLGGTKVGDKGVLALAAKDSPLITLDTLSLERTKVSDKGVSALANKESPLRTLATLRLGATKVGDKGVSALAAKDSGLTALTTLDLWMTQVGDEGAAALAAKDSGLKALTELNLSNTQVTEAGAAAIRKAHPNLKVFR